MSFLNKVAELGKKAGGFYSMAKKGLDTVVSLGSKAKNLIKSEPVQGILSVLPPQLQTGLNVAGKIGEKALTGLESLQSKLNSGEALAKRIGSSYQQAISKFELGPQPRQLAITMDEQGSSLRIPDKMVTGGSQRQDINTMTGIPKQGVMTF